MDIIFNRQIAEELSEKYLILELEEHIVEDKVLETFAVVSSDQIPLSEYTTLEHYKKLHSSFVQANKEKNSKLCNDLAEHLVGRWGGELDEFYNIVCSRFAKSN